ncbi:MAG: tRNA (guanosine(37)-N1)-methyltransferase TrmD [Proteobacteria bacterium]|nr:tRNA (guanosine(37)-N1)-methyltransferase TrmD [Pseudomonadota bacterium]
MRFNVITLFPELFEPLLRVGVLGRAVAAGAIEIHCVNPRAYTRDTYRSVDDTPYGGGAGMVMIPGPLCDAMDACDQPKSGDSAAPQRAHRVLLTPQGAVLTQTRAKHWSRLGALTLVCGRYEGFDERVRGHVDEELSLGDFVLSGGEVAAMAVIETVSRFVPSVLGNRRSCEQESHAAEGLLEYPQYTRPREFRGEPVPGVLLSGDHAAIAGWRRLQSLLRTSRRRPDLLARTSLSEQEQRWLARAGRDPDGLEPS